MKAFINDGSLPNGDVDVTVDLTPAVERYRAALERIADTKPHFAGQTRNEYWFQQWAREALGRETVDDKMENGGE